MKWQNKGAITERVFFAEEDEILHLSDGDAVVCSQWGIMNIPKFLEQARRFGYEIEEIE